MPLYELLNRQEEVLVVEQFILMQEGVLASLGELPYSFEVVRLHSYNYVCLYPLYFMKIAD